MIDPAMGRREICTVPLAQADLESNEVELAWHTRYPILSKNIVDWGIEFLVESII